MGAVSEDPHLITAVGAGAHVALVQRHAEQRSGDFLASAEQRIQLPWRRVCLNFFGKREQPVGFSGHGGYNHNHVVALAFETSHSIRDRTNPLH